MSTTAAESTSRWMRLLVLVNLGLVALQAVSAGLVMSGSGPAIILHARGALALALGAIVQAIAAVVLWARGRLPGWVARAGIVLFVLVAVEIAVGHTKRYWLHVPIAVAVFGGLLQQTSRLSAQRVIGGRS